MQVVDSREQEVKSQKRGSKKKHKKVSSSLTAVFHLRLGNVHCSIREIEVENTFPNAKVLNVTLCDCFLEVHIEAKDLSIIFDPVWLALKEGVE